MNFSELSLDPRIQSALVDMDYKEPTDIQAQVIPRVIAGVDLIALAQTGSGKTAACAIPLCHIVDETSKQIQGLVVVPTRELALQYSTEAQKIGRHKGLKVFALFGGEDMALQRAKLKDGVHILIATPGRLIDFIFARAIDLSHVKTLVLDEADQMLSLGFLEDLEFISHCLVQQHGTLLFSATMPAGIRKIASVYMKNPEEISLISDKPAPSRIEHQFFFAQNPKRKKEELLELLQTIECNQCLIFGNARHEVEDMTHFLKRSLKDVDFLHGGLAQNLRTTITNKFARGKIRYLVATDVAARGLDFAGVTHVINYHFPEDQETYVHRSGRTGRNGREGTCVTFLTSRDVGGLRKLLTYLEKPPVWISTAVPNGFQST